MSPIPGMLAGGELPGMERLDLNSEDVGNQLNTILSSFKTDSSLKIFLSEDFDAVKHVGNAIGNGTVSRSLQETENAANLVSAQVREEVIRRQDALLGEVEAVSALEQQIEALSNGLNKLATTTDQLVSSLNDPFEKIQRSIRKMKNAAQAADLLQKVVRFQTCNNKLQKFCSSNDSTDADGLKSTAEAVRELEELAKTPPLDRVDIVARELPAIRKASSEYKNKVTDSLRNAMASGDPLVITGALQSLALLGNLEERLNAEVKNLVAQAQKAIIEGFDTKQVVQKTAQSTQADISLPEMWMRLDGAVEQLHDVIVQVIKLQFVLQWKQDPTLPSSLNDATQLHVCRAFFRLFTKNFLDHVRSLNRAKSLTPGAVLFHELCDDYPRLLQSFGSLCDRLTNVASVSQMDGFVSGSVITRDELDGYFSDALLPIEKQYLALSLSRVTDPIISLFRPDAPSPGAIAANGLARLFTAELSSTMNDPKLFVNSSKNVAAALYMYAGKAQEVLGDVKDKNISDLYDGLYGLGAAARAMFGLQVTIGKEVTEAAEVLITLSETFLEKLFLDIRTAVDSSLLKMKDDIINEEGKASADSTAHVKERYILVLSEKLRRFKTESLDRVVRSRALSMSVHTLARQTLSKFVLHASLLWSLDLKRRTVLAADMSELEAVVVKVCAQKDLGESYSAFRAFRKLVQMEIDELASIDDNLLEILSELKPSCVMIHILGRARAPLIQPHRRMQWSTKHMVEWLDSHGEEEAMEIANECLVAYEKFMESDASQSADDMIPEYKLLKELGPRLLQRYKRRAGLSSSKPAVVS